MGKSSNIAGTVVATIHVMAKLFGRASESPRPPTKIERALARLPDTVFAGSFAVAATAVLALLS